MTLANLLVCFWATYFGNCFSQTVTTHVMNYICSIQCKLIIFYFSIHKKWYMSNNIFCYSKWNVLVSRVQICWKNVICLQLLKLHSSQCSFSFIQFVFPRKMNIFQIKQWDFVYRLEVPLIVLLLINHSTILTKLMHLQKPTTKDDK